MQVKRYAAGSMQDIMQQIRQDLGPDAIVLSSKRLRGEGAPRIEVMAARDDGIQEEFCGTEEKDLHLPPSVQAEVAQLKRGLAEMARSQAALQESLWDFMAGLGPQTQGKALPDKALFYRLLAGGISREGACKLMKNLMNGEQAGDRPDDGEGRVQALEGLLERRLSLVQGQKRERRIKAFVGATGVGKTTTVAKLAAHYARQKKSKVGLITTDTCRIGAVEQLKIYAGIMGIPLEVTSGEASFRRALQKYDALDVVLVDTPGISLGDKGSLESHRALLQAGGPLETNLLLSLTADRDHLFAALDAYEGFRFDHMILTRADECSRFGTLYDIMEQVQKPVLYLTMGQKVPDDIAAADTDMLARMIVRSGEPHEIARQGAMS